MGPGDHGFVNQNLQTHYYVFQWTVPPISTAITPSIRLQLGLGLGLVVTGGKSDDTRYWNIGFYVVEIIKSSFWVRKNDFTKLFRRLNICLVLVAIFTYLIWKRHHWIGRLSEVIIMMACMKFGPSQVIYAVGNTKIVDRLVSRPITLLLTSLICKFMDMMTRLAGIQAPIKQVPQFGSEIGRSVHDL